MSWGPVAALAAAAVLLFWVVGAYNRLFALRQRVVDAWQEVDRVLQRRGSAVAPLVTALREHLVGEDAALDALLSAQAQVAAAADVLRPRPLMAEGTQALARADALMAGARARVLALLDLQAEWREAQAVAPLVEVLRATEPELTFARQWFNAAVQAYNDAACQWPTRLLMRLFGFGLAGRL